METDEIVKKSIAISNAFDQMATRIFLQAKTLRAEQQISYAQYKQILDNYYLPLMNYASKILIDSSNQIIDDMEQYLTQIEEATDQLNGVSEKLKSAEGIFSGITQILAAAAAIATFAAAPSKDSFISAFNVVKQAVKSIGGIFN